ncbi:deoxyribose-phosphate aldolase [Meira miltonrushii]|uniref:deoxyribose-phosphate aldolase n=1 Tax=Meira miltonrushii TaxID=1280837 RepID=A0A316VEV1_9BASI|nr:deoxyribose-phosphate aldolase [Meira miltonrushii]PWN34843.1 deoxyribose-phosphate aldolase [Meira miltonrushii]
MSAPSLEEIQTLLSQIPQDLPPLNPAPSIPDNVASIIDHTLLAPNALPTEIEQCCRDAIELNAATVCVNSSMVAIAAKALQGTHVKPICTIGFPFGAGNTQGKVQETQKAQEDGAQEIDMVQNVGLLRAGKYGEVFEEIAAIAQAAKPAKLKVIIETCYLTREEIAISTLLACKAGAAFVKTSTGYGSGGAKAEDIRLMYQIASAHDVKVKASGGIRTAEKVKEMVANGASRIGASGTRAIVAEFKTGATSQQAAGSGY